MTRWLRRLFSVAVLATISSVPQVWADTIYLQNGNSIRGSIVRETQSGIIVRLAKNREILIRYEEITEIRRSDDGSSSSAISGGDETDGRRSATRDTEREKRLITRYAKALERIYLTRNNVSGRIPMHVRQRECNPVNAAQRYGLPIKSAESNRQLEDMFELTLRAYKNNSSPSWVRTLGYYQKTRQEYLEAISSDVELAQIYLDNPELPKLLHLRNG